jgi:hypothetical protein
MSIQQNFPAISPSLSLNLARSKTLDPRITFTRTSSGTRTNSQGLVEVVSANTPRFDHSYDPVSGTVRSLGLLIEESRTNLIRNNTAQGAVVGTPGTNPTNSYFFISPSGISREITSIGTENGITYFDVRYYGTSTSTGEISWAPQPANITPVTAGQTVTSSVYLKYISGDFTNIDELRIRILDYGPGYLRESSTSYATSLLQSPIPLRYTHTRTTGADTTGVVFSITLNKNASGPVDVTIRIGMPQLELGSFVTSVIPTSGSTVTRTADNVSMVGENFSDWYNQSEGTFVTEVTTATIATTGADWIRLIGGVSVNDNSIRLTRSGSGATPQLLVRKNDVSQTGPFSSNVESNVFSKLGIYYKTNDFGITRNGSSLTGSSVSVTGEVPTVDRMLISNPSTNGYIKYIIYYPRRLTNTQLQNLTR